MVERQPWDQSLPPPIDETDRGEPGEDELDGNSYPAVMRAPRRRIRSWSILAR